MRNRWATAIIFSIGVAIGLFLYWKHLTPKSQPYPDLQENTSSNLPRVGPMSSNTVFSASSYAAPAIAKSSAPTFINSPLADEPGMSDVAPATVMENMRSVFRLYSGTFGGNPVGTNPEITSALDGNNPKQTHFIQTDSGLRINNRGELIDAWGTPFFFHQLSGTQMEIHSAGPDRKMWTDDDLVIR